MIVLALGFGVTKEDSHAFWDVVSNPSSLYPYHFVAVAANNGLMQGYDDGSFRPLDNITRMQVVTTVARATAALLQDPPDDWLGSVDSSDLTHGQNLRRAEYYGLLAGIRHLADWDPKKAATRGEVAQILHNLLVTTAYRPPVSVSNYGARGDGITDDTLAIQKAIDARPGGGMVILSAGTYVVTSSISLRSNVTLKGTHDSIISGSRTSVFELSDARNVALDGFTVIGSTTMWDSGASAFLGPAISRFRTCLYGTSDSAASTRTALLQTSPSQAARSSTAGISASTSRAATIM